VKFIFRLIFVYYCLLIIFFGILFGCVIDLNGAIPPEISKIAQSVTVRLFIPSTNVSGSGVIIKKTNNKYLIITNEHVVETSPKNQLWVQTPDGKKHTANVTAYPFVKDDDLAVVELVAPEQYAVSRLGNSTNLKIGDQVYAVGFPFDPENPKLSLKITKGVAAMITKPLVGGYQIGYSNDVDRGMSGGPILNEQGDVIGINGIRKNPSLGDPFAFVDGSVIPEQTWKQMSELSWGIPIERFTEVNRAYIKL